MTTLQVTCLHLHICCWFQNNCALTEPAYADHTAPPEGVVQAMDSLLAEQHGLLHQHQQNVAGCASGLIAALHARADAPLWSLWFAGIEQV